jgi:glycosyltransferase involved in cell wall biosynthesis
VDGGLDSFRSDRRVKKIVAIDARMVLPIPHGIGRYVKNIATGLEDIARSRELGYEPVFLTDQRYPGLIPKRFTSIPVKTPFLKSSEIFELPKVLKSLRADLYHSPSFSSLAYTPCPWVATIHDLNHLHFGDFSKRVYYQLLLKRFAKKAIALLTVSEFARKELSEWIPCDLDRVEVVVNALDPEFSRPLRPLNRTSQDDFSHYVRKKNWENLRSGQYFICLSNPKSHKNLPFLVKSYIGARKQSNSLPPLVISADRSELALDTEGESSLVFTSKLDDAGAKLLLQHARAAFFPSLYEGFGLPPLEAIMSGVSVAVSDIPPHREGLQDFTGPEVHWFDPKKSDDWVGAFIRWSELPEPDSLRQSQVFLDERRQASERYSVERLSSHMDRIYRRVLRID